MAKPDEIPLLVFADDWGRHPSSCQHLVKELLPQFPVLWVNTVGTRRVRATSFTAQRGWEKLRNWRRGLRHDGERIAVVDVPMIPSSGGRIVSRINRTSMAWFLRRALKRLGLRDPLVLTTLPHVWPLVRSLPRRGAVYYCTDDYAFWPDADWKHVQPLEQMLVDEADAVLAISQALQRKFADRADCRYFPHGVDYEHFRSAGTSQPVAELARRPGPKVGFFGLLYEKLDYGLLTAVAKAIPDGTLAMIGRIDYCPDEFRALPNVLFPGPQPYQHLPAWLAGLDVLLLPYVDDPMIRQSNPLKLRECLATGKPTVSIDIPEARRYEPLVSVCRDGREFVENVLMHLKHPATEAAAARRCAAVAGETWSARAAELSELLQSIARQKGAPAA